MSYVCVCLQIPGPGAHKIVDLNVYKLRPPKYSMTANHPPPGDHSLKPGPGSHYPEKVFLSSILSHSILSHSDCLLRLPLR